jgi:hypothetical protein
MSEMENVKKGSLIRNAISLATLLVLFAAASPPSFSQSNPDLQAFFQQDIGLSQDQIAGIRSGQAVAKALPPRTPAEVFLFGAIYIQATPESYVQLTRGFRPAS